MATQNEIKTRQRTNESTCWAWIVKAAREDKAWRVERESMFNPAAPSLTHRAQDYGIVPHPPTKAMGPYGTCCAGWIAINATAAALIRWEYQHPWHSPSRLHLTAWETARIAATRS
jgi:hypothetical protein